MFNLRLMFTNLKLLSRAANGAGSHILLGIVALAQMRTPFGLVFSLRELVGRGTACPYHREKRVVSQMVHLRNMPMSLTGEYSGGRNEGGEAGCGGAWSSNRYTPGCVQILAWIPIAATLVAQVDVGAKDWKDLFLWRALLC
jgi:hypothetical protein